MANKVKIMYKQTRDEGRRDGLGIVEVAGSEQCVL